MVALRPICAFLILVLGAGCTTQVGTLQITVTRSKDPREEPLTGVAAQVRLRVDGPDLQVGPVVVPVGDRQATLDEVPVGDGRQITIDGLLEGSVVSRSRSGPFTVVSGNNEISLYMGRTDTQREEKGRFSSAPVSLHQARAFHTATLLPEGSVLLAGGTGEPWIPASPSWGAASPELPGQVLRSPERVDGRSLLLEKPPDCRNETACLKTPRTGHTATLLQSGNVLLAGGGDATGAAKAVELYDPGSRSFLAGGDMRVPLVWHEAGFCSSGLVLVGGTDPGTRVATDATAVYDKGKLGDFHSLRTARRAFALTQMPNGDLLATGGIDRAGNLLTSTELFRSSVWMFGPSLKRPRAHHSAILLPDGSVLVVGGVSYDENNKVRETAHLEQIIPGHPGAEDMNDKLAEPRWAHTATLLADGRVLVAGGLRNGLATNSAEVISVLGESRAQVQSLALNVARAGHTATRLGTDFVLVAGGVNFHESKDREGNVVVVSEVLSSLEVFVY